MIKDLVDQRIKMFGIKEEIDMADYEFYKMMIEIEIKNFCNITEIPQRLNFTMVDMIVGEWLQTRRQTGQLPEFDVEKAVKQVKIGDMTTQYESASNGNIDSFIGLLRNKEGDLISYRKMKW